MFTSAAGPDSAVLSPCGVHAGVLAADNEGAVLGRVLLETTIEGARQLGAAGCGHPAGK